MYYLNGSAAWHPICVSASFQSIHVPNAVLITTGILLPGMGTPWATFWPRLRIFSSPEVKSFFNRHTNIFEKQGKLSARLMCQAMSKLECFIKMNHAGWKENTLCIHILSCNSASSHLGCVIVESDNNSKLSCRSEILKCNFTKTWSTVKGCLGRPQKTVNMINTFNLQLWLLLQIADALIQVNFKMFALYITALLCKTQHFESVTYSIVHTLHPHSIYVERMQLYLHFSICLSQCAEGQLYLMKLGLYGLLENSVN